MNHVVNHVVGLLAAAALGVDGGGRNGVRKVGLQPCIAGNVAALLAGLCDAAANYLTHDGGVDACALHDAYLSGSEQLGCVQVGEVAVALANGRAGRFDDDRITHGCSPVCDCSLVTKRSRLFLTARQIWSR